MTGIASVVALSSLGGSCAVGHAQAVAYPAYTYQYQQQVYSVPYVEKVQFVAVEPYHAELVAGRLRAAEEAEEVVALRDEIAGLKALILEATQSAPAYPQPQYASPQQPQYAQPAYPAPQQPAVQAPSKAPPLPTKASPQLPPLPAKAAPAVYDPSALPPAIPVSYTSGGRGEAILRSKCASCHTGNGAKGGFVLFASDGRLLDLGRDRALDVAFQVESGNMPPKSPLSADESASLSDWLGLARQSQVYPTGAGG